MQICQDCTISQPIGINRDFQFGNSIAENFIPNRLAGAGFLENDSVRESDCTLRENFRSEMDFIRQVYCVALNREAYVSRVQGRRSFHPTDEDLSAGHWILGLRRLKGIGSGLYHFGKRYRGNCQDPDASLVFWATARVNWMGEKAFRGRSGRHGMHFAAAHQRIDIAAR